MNIEKIIETQKEFQRFVGFPIDSNLEQDRNELSEKYVFKLIEEAVELRKEFPSVANPWSKKQKEADINRIKEEMSDVFLFFMNIMATWKVSPEELFETIAQVQNNNFVKVKEKKLKMLNESISNIPGYTVKHGFGSVNPEKIYIGKFDGGNYDSSCYHTDVVKCELPNGRLPNEDELNFWTPIFNEELEILLTGNKDAEIIYV